MAKEFSKDDLMELVGNLEDLQSSNTFTYDSVEDRQIGKVIEMIYEVIDNK